MLPARRLSFVTVASDQAQFHVEFRSSQPTAPDQSPQVEDQSRERRWEFRFPSLRRRAPLAPLLDKTVRGERAEERERQRRALSAEAAKRAFFETPAGRARLAYKRGHRLFQYEIPVGQLDPVVVPGPVGSPAVRTGDPVDILNSVTVEGWKLVTGKFMHSELHGGAVGVYLFKRSQKRRLAMNDPWQAASIVDPIGTLPT